MIMYVAMIADRHADPEPFLFTTPDAAIGYARGQAQELGHHPEDFVESDPPPDGWLYHASYSVESDSVWVLAKTVDDPDGKVPDTITTTTTEGKP